MEWPYRKLQPPGTRLHWCRRGTGGGKGWEGDHVPSRIYHLCTRLWRWPLLTQTDGTTQIRAMKCQETKEALIPSTSTDFPINTPESTSEFSHWNSLDLNTIAVTVPHMLIIRLNINFS